MPNRADGHYTHAAIKAHMKKYALLSFLSGLYDALECSH